MNQATKPTTDTTSQDNQKSDTPAALRDRARSRRRPGGPRRGRRRNHGLGPLRGIDHVPCSAHHDKGRFGRLFGNLPGLRLPEETLRELASSMVDKAGKAAESRTPAGFTFFGQFVDHDITLDTSSSLDQQSDPAAIRNMRTPTLELDSVYGAGPEASMHLYDQEHEGRLLTGTEENPDDLPRNRQGIALIGDPRNDENGIISQLHLAFLRFHNVVLELVEEGKVPGIRYFDDDFQEAQRLVRWHYQWIIVNEYLPLIIDPRVLRSIDQNGLTLYSGHTPFIPVEFAVAAFRFGHSQVRNRYRLSPGRVVQLFPPPFDKVLTSFAPVPEENVIDWSFFFDITNRTPQGGRVIDAKVVRELFQLPFVPEGSPDSLPLRNLLRGQTFSLPSGEMVAHRMNVEPLTPEQLGTDLEQHPLWFYLLKEAETGREDRLGLVGGRIVAETLIGLMHCDPQSFASVAPNWRPTLPARRPGTFTMADLLNIAARGR